MTRWLRRQQESVLFFWIQFSADDGWNMEDGRTSNAEQRAEAACRKKRKIEPTTLLSDMKAKPYHPIRALRTILGQNQAEFAAMIGASKDTVVSWENGRNPLSAPLARRISLVTGVDELSLMQGSDPLLTRYIAPKTPFTLEAYDKHRKTFWGQTPEENVRRRIRPCADTLELLFLAAARAGAGEGCSRLPGLMDSFIQWCHQAREDFELGAEIDAELAKRKAPITLNKSYAGWREMAKTDPTMARSFGFKDNAKKEGQEMLELTIKDTVPVWMPGQSMRARTRR
jgi:DNA-binding transcriptional regulator YiaG